MEGIYLGKVTKGLISKNNAILTFDGHQQDITKLNDSIEYENTTYCLVPSGDIITTNDELLKLRDEVKELKIQIEMLEAANTDRAKNLLAMTKNRDYFEEKADSVEKKYKELVAEHTKLQAELMEIKTTRTLREAYIAGVEKGCESLREERDRWKRRWNSVVTDIGESLKANGITFVLKEIDDEGNWDVAIDIPELNRVKAENDKLRGMITTNFRDLLKESGINFELTQPNSPESLTLKFDIPELTEAKAKVADLEKKLAAAKSNETYWRDRKEEEEDCHHYWLHTFDRAVKQAAEKGIHIGGCGYDEDCHAGMVVVDNMKAEELEKTLTKIRAERDSLDVQNGSLRAVIDSLQKRVKRLEDDNSAKAEAVVAAKDRGDYWLQEHDVKSRMYQELEEKHDAKWTAMCDALKAKGVEVIYMGEEDGKPIIDIKVPGWESDKQRLGTFSNQCADLLADNSKLEVKLEKAINEIYILRKEHIVNSRRIGDLNKELEELKSKIGTCTLAAGADGRIEFIYTYMDGHNEAVNINCLCKDHVAVDAESISHGTIPTCKSCAHYVSGSRMADIWCHRPSSKEGPGTVRRLSTEEAESPACSDYKARKE